MRTNHASSACWFWFGGVPLTAALILSGRCLAAEFSDLSSVDPAAVQEHWQPQFGSRPVRVERLPGGGACLAFDATFARPGDRACWDWRGKLDLSKAGRVAFALSASNGGVGETIGIYFGTPGGWYARFIHGDVPEAWTRRAFRLDEFHTEGTPKGWDQVTTFRFSVWSNGAGKTTWRLRDFRTIPVDPAENVLKNGSFEIVSGGLPYGWSSGHWGLGYLPWATNPGLWRQHFRLDRTVARDGAISLCLENTERLPLLKAQSVWVTPPKSMESCALSAWLRSDRPALPVTLACGGKSTTVKAGREWTQGVLTGIPRASRMTVVIAPTRAGTLWIDAVQLQASGKTTAMFHAAADDKALAAREKAVDWSPPRRTAAIAAGRSTTGPVQPAPVTIDAHGRLLVGGKPYLQHSLGLEFVSDPTILDFAARSGFREVCLQIRPDITTDELKRRLDRCAALGLHVIPWLDGRIPRDLFRSHLTALKDHPALLCWYVYDEPSGERFAEANARLDLTKQLDPHHPALINYLSNKLTGHLGDIYSTDVYPIPRSSPMTAVNAVAQMERAARAQHKPVWIWLQGTGYSYSMDREPTPRELSCMVYGSLLTGARGIYYFAQIPRSKPCFDEMRALLVEVETVRPALFGMTPAPPVECDQANVMCGAFRRDNDVWVIAVNTQNKPIRARLSVSDVAPTGECVFEGRLVEAEAGEWEDDFGVYERHVYRFHVVPGGN